MGCGLCTCKKRVDVIVTEPTEITHPGFEEHFIPIVSKQELGGFHRKVTTPAIGTRKLHTEYSSIVDHAKSNIIFRSESNP
jgi:hypothetical protein